ncbi:hypothetical protein VP01_431g6 [Puccinia sorghi]|uniref:Uncharacterized protein n=1 Tax=Puccinia sorghi TaxID=27349 RepID=A0A0L6UQV8_9BASI|nr:hypothetical protein VP01_431g6 [Puccinia sorghi]
MWLLDNSMLTSLTRVRRSSRVEETRRNAPWDGHGPAGPLVLASRCSTLQPPLLAHGPRYTQPDALISADYKDPPGDASQQEASAALAYIPMSDSHWLFLDDVLKRVSSLFRFFFDGDRLDIPFGCPGFGSRRSRPGPLGPGARGVGRDLRPPQRLPRNKREGIKATDDLEIIRSLASGDALHAITEKTRLDFFKLKMIGCTELVPPMEKDMKWFLLSVLVTYQPGGNISIIQLHYEMFISIIMSYLDSSPLFLLLSCLVLSFFFFLSRFFLQVYYLLYNIIIIMEGIDIQNEHPEYENTGCTVAGNKFSLKFRVLERAAQVKLSFMDWAIWNFVSLTANSQHHLTTERKAEVVGLAASGLSISQVARLLKPRLTVDSILKRKSDRGTVETTKRA